MGGYGEGDDCPSGRDYGTEVKRRKKGIVIRAFADEPNFLGGCGFIRTVDDYARIFRQARSAGFTGVQPYLALESGVLNIGSSPQVLRTISNFAADEGIDIPSLEIAPLEYSFTSDSNTERSRGIDVVSRSLDIAAGLNATGVLVIPGYVGKMWDSETDQVDYEDAWNRTLACLQAVVIAAEQANVSVLVEPIWNMFLLSPLEMKRLIDEVGSPRCGVLLDTGNVTLFGFAEQWMRILGHRVQQVHMKDFRRQVGNINGFVPLLAGDVNWPAVVDAADRAAFEGYWIAEQFPFRHHGDSILEATSRAMDRILRMTSESAMEGTPE
jgi:hexulose-6-phosphate isomerase